MAVAIFVYPFLRVSAATGLFCFFSVVVVFIDDTDRFLRAVIFAEKKGSGLVRNTSANWNYAWDCVFYCVIWK